MRDEIDGRVLARYISGGSTPDEVEGVRAWAAADPARAELLDSLADVWRMSGRAPESWDVDHAWNRLVAARAPLPGTAAGGVEAARDLRPVELGPVRRPRWPVRGAPLPPAWVRAAVIAGVVVGSGLLWRPFRDAFNADPERDRFHEVATERGERARLRLADGSTVVLAPESHLSFKLDGERREVHLEGAAMFTVARDAERPFFVYAGAAVTRVLGTEFVVRAYAMDEDVKVAVVEGEVAVRAHGAPDSRGVELTAGELGTIAENGAILESRVADVSIFSSWTGGRLVFDNAPVREVLAEIGRWYDADIRMADTVLANQGLTITLEGEALGDVLRTLAIALEVDYRRDGRTVDLIPRR